MDITNDCRAMERLLKDLLPIDCPQNVYILTPVEAGERFCMNFSLAFTGAGCDLRLKPRLIELGLWRGPGFAMVIQETERFSWMMQTEQLGIVLHEFSHFLWFDPSRANIAEMEAELAGKPFLDPSLYPDRLKTPEELAAARDAHPFAEHGLIFNRICLHLRYRCAVNSYDVPVDDLFIGGPRYCLSPAQEYLIALGDEPKRRAAERIVDIVETEPPAEFTALFVEDVKRYLEPKIRAELMRELMSDPKWIPNVAALLDAPT